MVVGLFVAMMLWRSGPLGDLRLIYTPTAIVIAQTVIAAPVVTGLTAAALQQLNPRLRLQLLGWALPACQMVLALWREARLPLLAALMAGFGSRHLGGGRFHDGGRQHQGSDARADHRHRPGNRQRRI